MCLPSSGNFATLRWRMGLGLRNKGYQVVCFFVVKQSLGQGVWVLPRVFRFHHFYILCPLIVSTGSLPGVDFWTVHVGDPRLFVSKNKEPSAMIILSSFFTFRAY